MTNKRPYRREEVDGDYQPPHITPDLPPSPQPVKEVIPDELRTVEPKSKFYRMVGLVVVAFVVIVYLASR